MAGVHEVGHLRSTARAESVIDPQTGVLLKRIGMPRDATIGYLPGSGDHNFTAVRSMDGAWDVHATTWSIADASLVKIVVGSGSATVTTTAAHGLAANSRVTISGLAVGNGLYAVSGTTATTFMIGQGGLPSNTTLADATLQVTAYAGTADNGTTTNFHGTNSNFLLLRDDAFSTGINLHDSYAADGLPDPFGEGVVFGGVRGGGREDPGLPDDQRGDVLADERNGKVPGGRARVVADEQFSDAGNDRSYTGFVDSGRVSASQQERSFGALREGGRGCEWDDDLGVGGRVLRPELDDRQPGDGGGCGMHGARRGFHSEHGDRPGELLDAAGPSTYRGELEREQSRLSDPEEDGGDGYHPAPVCEVHIRGIAANVVDGERIGAIV